MFIKKLLAFSGLVGTLLLYGCAPGTSNDQTSSGTGTGKQGNLVEVESVEVMLRESLPVQASAVVKGNFRNGCEKIGNIDQELVDNIFHITIFAKTEGDMCTQALVPFEETVPLEAEGLKAGTYTVNVNGVTENFTLDVDNVANEQTTTSSLPAGDFKEEDGNFYGTVYVTGYAQTQKVNEAFCTENCKQYDYVFFHVEESSNKAFQDFLNKNQGNAYAGQGVIGLGCFENGIIRYENDSDEKGTQNLQLSQDLSKKITGSTKESPVTLKLTRLKYTSGRGAPACYSHITQVEEYSAKSDAADTNSKTTDGRIMKGVIEGSMGYPSQTIPADIQVCADNLDTKETLCTKERINDKKYQYGVGYTLDVGPGKYYVYEIFTSPEAAGNFKDYKAYYSEFVTCGMAVNCTSHKPLVVEVEPGETVTGINPVDWYNTSAAAQ